ncbi:peroxide stress protein YaaA [Buchananella felis]|uniref:YaaA family protein n=1 Tax=Buchananella felis TaxID=3231492 RepID=UPI003528DB61
MLILLPPSRTMFSPAAGAPYDPAALSFASVADVAALRSEVAAAYVSACSAPDGAKRLGLTARQAAELPELALLESRPALAAGRAYTGVLYAAAGIEALAEPGAQRAGLEVLIASALYGWVRPSDVIAPYRLAMGSSILDRPLAAAWRKAASAVLAAKSTGRLTLDCRSGEYQAAAPAKACSGEYLALKAVTVRDGAEKTVSHFAKHYRGVLTGALVELAAGRDLSGFGADDVAQVAATLPEVKDVRLTPGTLTLVV